MSAEPERNPDRRIARILTGDIITLTAEVCGCEDEVITGKRQDRAAVWPRFMAMAAMERWCPHLSTTLIGRHVGGRDHTTVISALRRFKHQVSHDADLAYDWDQLNRRISAWVSGEEGPWAAELRAALVEFDAAVARLENCLAGARRLRSELAAHEPVVVEAVTALSRVSAADRERRGGYLPEVARPPRADVTVQVLQ